MVNAVITRTALSNFLTQNGNDVRLKYYTLSYSGNNYDNSYLSASGTTVWVKGYLQTLGNPNSAEQKLMEAGNLLINDSKLYIPGSLSTDVDEWTKFGVGSPTMQQYSAIENGKTTRKIGSTPIYNLIYVRTLNTGSFIDEIA